MEPILKTLIGAPNKDQPIQYVLSPRLENHKLLCTATGAVKRTCAARLLVILLPPDQLLQCKSIPEISQKISGGKSIAAIRTKAQNLLDDKYICVVNSNPGKAYRAGYKLTDKGKSVLAFLLKAKLVPVKSSGLQSKSIKSSAVESSITEHEESACPLVPLKESELHEIKGTDLNRAIRDHVNAMFLPHGDYDLLKCALRKDYLVLKRCVLEQTISHADCLLYTGSTSDLSKIRRLVVDNKLREHRFSHANLQSDEEEESREIARHHPVYCEIMGTTHERCIRPGHLAFGSNGQNQREGRMAGGIIREIRDLLSRKCI